MREPFSICRTLGSCYRRKPQPGYAHWRQLYFSLGVPIGRNLTFSLKLDAIDCLLGLQTKLHQEVVVDVTCYEGTLVDADGSWDIIFFSVFGLVDERMAVFGCNSSLIEVQLKGPNSYF